MNLGHVYDEAAPFVASTLSFSDRKRLGHCPRCLRILDVLLLTDGFDIKLEGLQLRFGRLNPRVDIEEFCGLDDSSCFKQCLGRNSDFNSITIKL